jgi:hypothetical protein
MERNSARLASDGMSQDDAAATATRRTRPDRLQGRPVRTRELVVQAADYVTIPLAASMTGYSEKAIRRKIEDGVWLQGREFARAPDGHILINMVAYHAWVAKGQV